jgi:copper(I)-binding protein
VLARADSAIRERTMVVGQSYPVQFRPVPNHAQLTADQLNAKAVELKSVQFGRVEDVDYRKGAGNEREVYFNVTGQDSTGAYMKLRSASDAAIVAIASPAVTLVELHAMQMDGGVMKMRRVDKLPLPAGKTVELGPSGYHVMLTGLQRPLSGGDKVALTLTVKDARGATTRIEVQAPVRPLGASEAAPHGTSHTH